jgi:hypothetical protein
MNGFENINWDFVMKYPETAAAIALVSFVAGVILMRLIYNQSLMHQKDLVGHYKDIADGKLPSVDSFRRHQSMTLGWILLYGGLAASFAGILMVSFERSPDLSLKILGHKWSALTQAEIDALSDKLKPLVAFKDAQPIHIFYLNEQGKDLADTLATAFNRSGWPSNVRKNANLEAGLGVGQNNETAKGIRDAIRATTKISPIAVDSGDPRIVFVGVGIKAN